QARRPAEGGDREDRAAAPSHQEVAGEQRLAELGDVRPEVVMRTRGPQLAQVSVTGGVKHPEARSRERLDRRVIDRSCSLRAAEHEHARLLRADPEAGTRSPTVARWRGHRAPRDAI